MSGTPDILVEIARDRRERVRLNGREQGLSIPSDRQLPLVNFHHPKGVPNSDGILIAEVKRKSPSKGAIAEIPEPAALAARYAEAGFRRVSVLTEELRFGGSLADLMAVKQAHPHLAILRKDFLLDVQDVEVSYRAGADAILLIATLLDADVLNSMYRRAMALGLTALVELHTQSDADKVRSIAPPLVGINSRNLRIFRVDPLIPLQTRSFIDWPCDVIFESGITCADDALFVRGTDFAGFLVGETLARSPELARGIVSAWKEAGEAKRCYSAWKRLYSRYEEGIPLVKICGLATRDDVRAAADAGADLLGFIMAESPRKVDADFIRSCADLDVQKVAVVVLKEGESVPPEIIQLVEDDVIDFIQFHGQETPEMLRAWPSFKAITLRLPDDAKAIEQSGSPAVLVDAFVPGKKGGTGKQLDPHLIEAAAEHRQLWIAGGLTPDNIRDIVSCYRPGLVDVSTGVALSGDEKRYKDHDKIRQFIALAKQGIQGGSL